MNSRPVIVLILVGVGGFCAMGMIARVAVQSDTQLKNALTFKGALLSELEGDGVHDVSVRRRPDENRFEVDIVTARSTPEGRKALCERVAELFVTVNPDRRANVLRVTVLEPGGLFRSAGAAAAPNDISLYALRARKALEVRMERIAKLFETRLGAEVVDYDVSEGVAAITLRAADLPDGRARSTFLSRLEGTIRKQLRGLYSTLELRFVAPESSSPAPEAQDGESGSSGAVAATDQEEPTVQAATPILVVRYGSRGQQLSDASTQKPENETTRPEAQAVDVPQATSDGVKSDDNSP